MNERTRRVLIVSGRPPDPAGKGDQVRAFTLASVLRQEGDDVRVFTPSAPVWVRVLSAVSALVGGRPGQVGWMLPPGSWRRVRRLASAADVVVVVTVRCVRGPLPAPLITDHVDCLSVNMAVRSRIASNWPMRMAARIEAGLLARHERRVRDWSTLQLAVGGPGADAIPGDVDIVPIAHPGRELWPDPADRDIDVVFTGVMTYPPNRSAANLIVREIAPEIRRRLPGAKVVIAGRGAKTLGPLAGVEIASDVPDLLALLGRAKIALAPMGLGTGQQHKLLDAACAGCAIVASEEAARGLGYSAAVATQPLDLARLVVQLLEDPDRRQVVAHASRLLAREHSPEVVGKRLAALVHSASRGW